MWRNAIQFGVDRRLKKLDTRCVKPPVVILVLSLAANLVLTSFVIGRRAATNPAPGVRPPANTSPNANLSYQSAGENSLVTATDSAGVNSMLNGFQWSQLESAEYPEYIARLRAFGVPEKVIRDIIIADVTKLYRPRFAALRPPKKPKNPNFWETRNLGYSPDREITAAQREQTRALRKEQTDLIKQLLGADVYEAMAKESGYPDWTERTYGTLSKEVRNKISDMQQRFQDGQSEIYAKADGYIDQDTQAELAALRKRLRAELATVLTPEQLEDYELRSSETAQRMRWELSAFEPDEKEFRAIHAAKQTQEEIQALLNPEMENTEAIRQQIKDLQKKQKELEASLADTLGTNRAREYKLMDQYEYRNLLEAGVSKDAVFQIVDMRTEVEKATAKVRSDQTLTKEQRTATLLALKAETDKTLKELLGERRAKAYQNQGGYWLRNIAPSN